MIALHTGVLAGNVLNRRTGWLFPGSRYAMTEIGLVVADTSGSTWDYGLIDMCLGVVNQIAEEQPVDFMQCDCEKTDGSWRFDRKRAKLEFKGKGVHPLNPSLGSLMNDDISG